MTIDEANQYLIALKHCETCEATDTDDCKVCDYQQKGSSAKCYDAIDKAIDIMRKYEKIIRGYDAAWELHHMKPTIDNIREVLDWKYKE